MTSSRWSKVFPCLLVAGLAWAPACGDGGDDDEPAAGAGSSTGGSGTGGSGTGGSGTGGSGTGGSGGGGLPDTVTVTGRRDPDDVVTTTSSGDMTKIFTGLEGVASAAYSVTVNVKLQDAASVEVTSPSSNCADIDAMQWTLSPSQMSFAFTGQDVLPATDCADFADDVVAGGVTARFTDVPVLNSSEKIKTLILEFKP